MARLEETGKNGYLIKIRICPKIGKMGPKLGFYDYFEIFCHYRVTTHPGKPGKPGNPGKLLDLNILPGKPGNSYAFSEFQPGNLEKYSVF